MKHFQFLCYNHHVLNKGGLKMKDLEQLYETVKKRNPNDKEFLQAVEEANRSVVS